MQLLSVPTFLLGELNPREGEKKVLLKHHTHEKSLKLRIFIWDSTKLLPAPQAALHPGLVCRVQRAQEGEEIKCHLQRSSAGPQPQVHASALTLSRDVDKPVKLQM